MIVKFLCTMIVFLFLSGYAHAGYIEICKDSFPNGLLTGLFTFTIAGQSGVVTVPVGACSADFQLPDGTALITEIAQPGSTLFDVSTFPDDRLDSFDLTTGTAQVEIVPGDISNETVVTFVNPPSGPAATPEPGTAWLCGSVVAFWAVRRNLKKRSSKLVLSTCPKCSTR